MPQSADREITRRALLRSVGLLILAGAAGTVFYPSSPDIAPQNPPPSPMSPIWRDVPVPADEALHKIDFGVAEQHPDIGLKDLYFLTSDKAPALAVCSIWDANTNNDARKSRYKLTGKAGFQPIETGFVPDSEKFVVTDLTPYQKEIGNFASKGLISLAHELGESASQQLVTFSLLSRPEAGRRFALVFGQGAVEYKGELSPAAYLSLGFQFDRLSYDTRKMA